MVSKRSLETGDLLVWGTTADSKGKKFNYLNLVRLLTISNFGHVSIVIKENNQLSHVEAVQPFIRLIPIFPSNELYVIPMGLGDRHEDIKDFFREKIGLPYSTMDAIRAWLGITLKDEDKWQCAELCLELYRSLSLDIPNAFTPNDLVKTIMRELEKPLLKYSAFKGA